MARITCDSCGHVADVSRRTASVRCHRCRVWIDVAPWRRLWAVEELEARVQSDRDLPGDLREYLEDGLAKRVESMRRSLGVEKWPTEEVVADRIPDDGLKPPPLPVPPPVGKASEPSPTGEPVEATAAPLPSPIAAAPVSKRPPRPKPKPVKAARQGPSIWERLGPVFAENLGFGLAAFLIVAGAVYFTTTAWTKMRAEQQMLVVAGGLVLLGSVLFAAARLFNRGGKLPEVERILLLIVAFLLPLAAVPAGILLERPPLWWGVLAAVVVLGLGFLATRRLARVLDPHLSPFLPVAYAGLSALVLAGGRLGVAAPMLAAAGASFALLGAMWLFAARVVPRVAAHRTIGLWPAFLMAFAGGVFASRVAIATATGPEELGTILATLGILAAASGAGLVTLEPALFARRFLGRRRSVVLLVVAMALGITGTLMAVGNPVGLFFASLLGAYACLRAGLALPVPWFAIPGLLLAAVAYLYSPSLFREAALRFRDQVADSLVIERQSMLAWYGLTFLPYVAACGVAALWFLKRQQPARGRVFLVWTVASATGLAALAMFASEGDLRPPAMVFAAQGALLLALGWASRNRWFAFGGALGIEAGAACALARGEATLAVTVLGLSVLALVFVGAAMFLARPTRWQNTAVQAGLLDGAAALAAVLLCVAVLDGLKLLPAPWWHGFAYVALTLLLSLIAFAYRRPENIAAAALALAGAGARFVVGVAPEAGGDLYLLVLAALSALPLLAGRIDSLLPERLRHPEMKAGRAIGSWTPVSAMVVQAVGIALLFGHLPDPGWTLTLGGGLLLGSAVLALAATREGQPWPLYPAVLQLVAAGIVTGNALRPGPDPGPWYGASALAGAAGALVLVGVPLWLAWPRALVGRLAPPLRHGMPLLVGSFAIWAFVLPSLWFAGALEALDGGWLAAACLAVAASIRLALWKAPASTSLRAAGLAAGTLFAPAAVGLLSAVADPAPHAWPLALLGAGAVTLLWAGRAPALRVPAGLHVLLALAAATAIGVDGGGDPGWLLLTFALSATAGYAAARRFPVAGWTVVLVALLLGISIPLCGRILEVDLLLQPAIWLLFAAAAYASLRVRGLDIAPNAVRLVADPIVLLAIFGALFHALWVVRGEPPTDAPTGGLGALAPNLRLGEAALFLAVVVRGLVMPIRAVGWRAIAVLGAGIAVFAIAPVNMLLHGGDARFWRPDVEIGLLAALLALALPLAAKARSADGTGRLGTRVAWPLLLAGFGLLLTFAEFTHLSTPLTMLAVTVTAVLVLVRDRGAQIGYAAGLSALVTALLFAAWWHPVPGALLYGAVSAVIAAGLGLTARGLTRESRPGWLRRAGSELEKAALISTVLAFLSVAGDVFEHRGETASGLQVALAAVALAIPAAAALWGALKADRPHWVHVALLAGLLFYAFLVQRTGVLAFLDGYHLHALVVFGATLLFAAEFHADPLGRWLAVDGLLLSAPAVLYYAPAALGLWGDYGPASSALALAAVSAGAGARRLGSAILGGAAAALLNLVLFAFWRRHGIVEPPFYGIPAGLTLLGAAVLLRGKITRTAHLGLVVPGLALLYGSVAIQVLRTSDPLHALLLFGLGFATVVLGFRFRRNAWLVTGIVVIVLDVVAYLLRHGFESGFFGAALLVGAGLAVMAIASLATLRRRKDAEAAEAKEADADAEEADRDA